MTPQITPNIRFHVQHLILITLINSNGSSFPDYYNFNEIDFDRIL